MILVDKIVGVRVKQRHWDKLIMLIVLKIAAVHITKLIFTCSGIFISDVRTSSDFYYIHFSLILVFIKSTEVAGTETQI